MFSSTPVLDWALNLENLYNVLSELWLSEWLTMRVFIYSFNLYKAIRCTRKKVHCLTGNHYGINHSDGSNTISYLQNNSHTKLNSVEGKPSKWTM